jgi:hypothetical protein
MEAAKIIGALLGFCRWGLASAAELRRVKMIGILMGKVLRKKNKIKNIYIYIYVHRRGEIERVEIAGW